MRIALLANSFPERDDGGFTPAVIDTLRRLSEKHEICVFALGGMQPLEKKTYRVDRLRVIAIGPATKWNFGLKQQLSKYDLLISLSLHEAQGMAMIEGAAAGLPILATRVGVAEELAGLGAAIVFVDEPQDALAGLQQCLQNLGALQRQAIAAAAKIRAQYDLAFTVRRFEEHYEQMAPKEMALWHQTKMPVSMKLRRMIRPLAFRLARLVLGHRLKKNADTEIDGMTLGTNVDVFHPKYFFSSRILGGYVAECVSANQRVLDMGTGSGVVGIMAAKRGAQVLGVDINPAAVTLANDNACRQNLNGRWRCLESDLFARLDPAEQFDWISFNPPFFSGPVHRPADAAWYAGENYDTIERFLAQARHFLAQNGRIVLVVSSDMPLASLDGRFRRYGYDVVAHQRREHFFEIFHLVQLQAGLACNDTKTHLRLSV